MTTWFKLAQASQAASPATSQYSIQKGDTLGSIAKKLLGNEGRWKEIQALNPGIDPRRLAIGQSINIPVTNSGATPQVANTAPQVATSTNNAYKLADIKSTIMSSEGFRSKSYFDPPTQKVNKAIGYGFNLSTRADAKRMISSLGLDFDKVFAGTQGITEQQANYLLDEALRVAISDAQSIVANFNSYPETVQSILVDMSYNLGGNKLAKFKNMIQAINSKNYKLAADEMVNSAWYGQVGNRSKRLVELMRGIK